MEKAIFIPRRERIDGGVKESESCAFTARQEADQDQKRTKNFSSRQSI